MKRPKLSVSLEYQHIIYLDMGSWITGCCDTVVCFTMLARAAACLTETALLETPCVEPLVLVLQ